jgi:hypothetical protein
MRTSIAVLTLAILLAAAGHAVGQEAAPESLDRFFRIEWQAGRDRKGAAVDGYIHNHGPRDAERIRLRIERLDARGAVVGTSNVWVLGAAPLNGRAYFKTAVPEAAGYRVSVSTFEWSCSGGSGGSM